MERLYDKLKAYSESDFYAFHMPGHKRKMHMSWDANPYTVDITEIEGFDDLHHPEHDERNAQEIDDRHDQIADREHPDGHAGEIQSADDE